MGWNPIGIVDSEGLRQQLLRERQGTIAILSEQLSWLVLAFSVKSETASPVRGWWYCILFVERVRPPGGGRHCVTLPSGELLYGVAMHRGVRSKG